MRTLEQAATDMAICPLHVRMGLELIQKETDAASKTAELVIMTHEAREAAMQSALKAVEGLDVVQEIGPCRPAVDPPN